MKKIIFAILAFNILSFPSYANEKLNIVTTIKPIDLLVQSVLGDTNKTNLLIQNTASPHGYQLKPSQIRLLQNANIIFYIDDSFERFLKKPFQNAKNIKKIALSDSKNINLLSYRKNGAWEKHEHNDKHEHHAHDHKEEFDMHIWLSPNNAIAMVKNIENQLSQLDPSNKKIYELNAVKEITKIQKTDKKIKTALKDIKNKPYIVFHDAYHYFENHYKLNAVGSITIEPDHPLSAMRIREIQEKIYSTKAVCIFKEPQFSDKYMNTLQAENSSLKIAELDPLGKNKNVTSYSVLLNTISHNLAECLK